jgi:PadR family transcriptional regulator, regulatory protein AphA
MTGYELARQFGTSIAYAWRASHTQVYPELRKLERAGLVQAQEVARGDRATKRRYSITQAGCDELMHWIDQVEPPSQERSTALLRTTCLEYASFETARRHFSEHLAHFEEARHLWDKHLEVLRRRDTTLMGFRLAKARSASHDAVVAYKVHVYEGLSQRAALEIAWAQRGLELVDQLQREGDVPVWERPNLPTPFDTSASAPSSAGKTSPAEP